MDRCRIAGMMLVAFVACGIVWSQEAPKPTTKAQAAAEKASGRLPNNYGKIGLSDEQKQRIYGVQAKYADQIELLTKQIKDLQSKRDAEIDGVLSAEQKEKLKTLLKESAAKKAASKPDGDK